MGPSTISQIRASVIASDGTISAAWNGCTRLNPMSPIGGPLTIDKSRAPEKFRSRSIGGVNISSDGAV
jgi:hypothetical protein